MCWYSLEDMIISIKKRSEALKSEKKRRLLFLESNNNICFVFGAPESHDKKKNSPMLSDFLTSCTQEFVSNFWTTWIFISLSAEKGCYRFLSGRHTANIPSQRPRRGSEPWRISPKAEANNLCSQLVMKRIFASAILSAPQKNETQICACVRARERGSVTLDPQESIAQFTVSFCGRHIWSLYMLFRTVCANMSAC